MEPRENVSYVHPDSVPAGGNKVLVIDAITGGVKNRDNYFPFFHMKLLRAMALAQRILTLFQARLGWTIFLHCLIMGNVVHMRSRETKA